MNPLQGVAIVTITVLYVLICVSVTKRLCRRWRLIPNLPSCIRCGYALVNDIPRNCPECGAPLKLVKPLMPSRRVQKEQALIALIIVLPLWVAYYALTISPWSRSDGVTIRQQVPMILSFKSNFSGYTLTFISEHLQFSEHAPPKLLGYEIKITAATRTGSSPQQPGYILLKNPDDIREQLGDLLVKQFGEDLSSPEIDAFVSIVESHAPDNPLSSFAPAPAAIPDPAIVNVVHIGQSYSTVIAVHKRRKTESWLMLAFLLAACTWVVQKCGRIHNQMVAERQAKQHSPVEPR